jgi:hypothetical protein
MVVTPGVEGCERATLFVVWRPTHEVLSTGMRQGVDGTFEAEPSKLLRLTGPWPEPGAPKQPLSVRGFEPTPPYGDAGHAE